MSSAEVMKLPPSICGVDDCTKRAHARGYCKVCYYRLRRQGTLDISMLPIVWRHRISKVHARSKTGTCAAYGPHSRLIKRGTGTGGWRCYETTRIRCKDWKAKRRAELRKEMLDHCEICGATDRLRWDHKHGTSKYRGTLCDYCNKGIGHFFDDPAKLVSAAKYLTSR